MTPTREEFLQDAADRHAQAVYNLCLKVLRNQADAEDAAQEAFAALAKEGPLRDEGATKTWLLRTALRMCWRSSSRKRNETRAQREVATMRPEETSDRGSLMDWVSSAVEALPEPLRLPIVLRYYQSLEYGEIAEVLGCPAGSVSARLREGQDALRKALPVALATMTLAGMEEAMASVPQATVPAGLGVALGKIATGSVAGTAATGGLIVTKGKALAMATLLACGTGTTVWWLDRRAQAGEMAGTLAKQKQEENTWASERQTLTEGLAGLRTRLTDLERKERNLATQTLSQKPEAPLLENRRDRAREIVARIDEGKFGKPAMVGEEGSERAREAQKLLGELITLWADAVPVIEDFLFSSEDGLPNRMKRRSDRHDNQLWTLWNLMVPRPLDGERYIHLLQGPHGWRWALALQGDRRVKEEPFGPGLKMEFQRLSRNWVESAKTSAELDEMISGMQRIHEDEESNAETLWDEQIAQAHVRRVTLQEEGK